MERKTARDFDQGLLNLFDQYVHGALDRRGFLERAAKYASGGVTAAMLLDQLNPQFVAAQQIAKDDKRIKTESVEYPSPKGNSKTRVTSRSRRMRKTSCRVSSSFTRTVD
jgi:carboxymethylenebutenolidase